MMILMSPITTNYRWQSEKTWLVSALTASSDWPKKPDRSMLTTNEKRSSDSLKDTSFDIGTNDVTIDVKVDPDEFSLKGGINSF